MPWEPKCVDSRDQDRQRALGNLGANWVTLNRTKCLVNFYNWSFRCALTSSKTQLGVDEMFQTMFEMCAKAKDLEELESPSKNESSKRVRLYSQLERQT